MVILTLLKRRRRLPVAVTFALTDSVLAAMVQLSKKYEDVTGKNASHSYLLGRFLRICGLCQEAPLRL